MNSRVPNGFHQALVSTTVFLAGITLAYLKFFVLDTSSDDWSLFAVVSAGAAVIAMIIQVATLQRALLIANDDPERFSKTAKLLMWSIWILIGSGVSLIAAHWWQPWPDLTNWLNHGGS